MGIACVERSVMVEHCNTLLVLRRSDRTVTLRTASTIYRCHIQLINDIQPVTCLTFRPVLAVVMTPSFSSSSLLLRR